MNHAPDTEDRAQASGEMRRPAYGWLIAVTALAVALRLFRLGARSFWQDEVWVLLKSEHMRGVLTEGLFTSNHPPLMPALVWLWRVILPEAWQNEFTLRLVPAALGVGAVLAAYFCARRLLGERTGLMAGFLTAISPVLILASREMKDYVTLPMTGTLAVLALVNAWERNRKRDWTLYALAAAAACYSVLFAAPLLLAVNLWFLLQLRGRRDRLKGWLTANVAGALLFAPQLAIQLSRVDALLVQATEFWVPKPNLWNVAFYLKALAFGYSDLRPHFRLALVLYSVLFCAGAWWALRTRPHRGLLCLMWFVVPVGLLYAISHLGQSAFLMRMMLPCAIPFYILAAHGAMKSRRGWLRATFVILFGATALFSLNDYYRDVFPLREFPHRPGVHPDSDFRGAARYLKEHIQPEDILVHPDVPPFLPLYWYGIRDNTQYVVAVDQAFINYFHAANPHVKMTEPFHTVWPSLIAPTVKGRDRVWYVYSAWEREHLHGPTMKCWRWLDVHMTEVERTRFRGLELYLYVPRTGEHGVQTVGRDNDNGVTATVTHRGAREGPYAKTLPDMGLVPRPAAERRGRLRLRFAGERFAEPGTVRFMVTNESDAPARFDWHAVPSQALVRFAALEKADPATPLWRVEPMGTVPPGPEFYELPVLTGRVHGDGHALATGQVTLRAGRYDASLFVRGETPDRPWPAVSVRLAGHDLLRAAGVGDQPLGGWHWLDAGTVRVDAPGPQPVEVSLQGRPGLEEQQAGLAWLALQPEQGGSGGTRGFGHAEGIALEPGGERIFETSLPPWAERIDVWVFEEGSEGRAYHIFALRSPGGTAP